MQLREREFVLKLAFDGKIKRVRMQSDYETLYLTVKDSFEELKDCGFSLNYIDDELDTIAIENEEDYITAIQCGNKMNSILKIYIEKKESHYDDSKLVQTCIHTAFLSEESQLQHDAYFALRCEVCFRIFTCRKSFEIHANVCERVFKKKRTRFDSRLMRMRGIAWENDVTLLYLNTLFTLRKDCDGLIASKREECFLCHRMFSPNSFEVHLRGCKHIIGKRTPFDSKKQRTSGQLEIFVRKSSVFNTELKKLNKPDAVPIWKRNSIRLRNIIKISWLLHKKRH